MSLNIKPISITDGETIVDDLFDDINNNFTKVKLEVDSLSGDVNNLLSGGTIKNELDIVIARADKDIADLNSKFTKIDTTKAQLDVLSASATETKAILEPLTQNATTIKNQLTDVNTEANILNTDLVGKNSIAQTTKAELMTEINTADEKLQAFKSYDTTELVPKANTMLNDMYCNKELLSINHELNCYPIVQLIYTQYGAGIGGAGDFPAGASSECNLMQNKTVYLDKNNIKIYVSQNYYISNCQINKISNLEYIVTSTNSTRSILIKLDANTNEEFDNIDGGTFIQNNGTSVDGGTF